MLINFVNKEISGLKEKQKDVLQQLQQVQRDLQKLQDTNLVISGALQALQHVVDEYNRASTSASEQEPVPLGDSPLPVQDGETL